MTADTRSTPQGAHLVIQRYGSARHPWSQVWMNRWMLPTPLTSQAQAVHELACHYTEECFSRGRRNPIVVCHGDSDYWHLTVPRDLEDEAVESLLAIETMDAPPARGVGSRSLEEMDLWHNPNRPSGVLGQVTAGSESEV
jgi:hypothetical protein